jgi:hypothetical protein
MTLHLLRRLLLEERSPSSHIAQAPDADER